jgi:hypothetical protein
LTEKCALILLRIVLLREREEERASNSNPGILYHRLCETVYESSDV